MTVRLQLTGAHICTVPASLNDPPPKKIKNTQVHHMRKCYTNTMELSSIESRLKMVTWKSTIVAFPAKERKENKDIFTLKKRSNESI